MLLHPPAQICHQELHPLPLQLFEPLVGWRRQEVVAAAPWAVRRSLPLHLREFPPLPLQQEGRAAPAESPREAVPLRLRHIHRALTMTSVPMASLGTSMTVAMIL